MDFKTLQDYKEQVIEKYENKFSNNFWNDFKSWVEYTDIKIIISKEPEKMKMKIAYLKEDEKLIKEALSRHVPLYVLVEHHIL